MIICKTKEYKKTQKILYLESLDDPEGKFKSRAVWLRNIMRYPMKLLEHYREDLWGSVYSSFYFVEIEEYYGVLSSGNVCKMMEYVNRETCVGMCKNMQLLMRRFILKYHKHKEKERRERIFMEQYVFLRNEVKRKVRDNEFSNILEIIESVNELGRELKKLRMCNT